MWLVEEEEYEHLCHYVIFMSCPSFILPFFNNLLHVT